MIRGRWVVPGDSAGNGEGEGGEQVKRIRSVRGLCRVSRARTTSMAFVAKGAEEQ